MVNASEVDLSRLMRLLPGFGTDHSRSRCDLERLRNIRNDADDALPNRRWLKKVHNVIVAAVIQIDQRRGSICIGVLDVDRVVCVLLIIALHKLRIDATCACRNLLTAKIINRLNAGVVRRSNQYDLKLI